MTNRQPYHANVVLCFALLCCAVLCCAVCAVLCVLPCTALCCVLCCATLYCVCCAVLFCTVLHRAMLCCAAQCCAVILSPVQTHQPVQAAEQMCGPCSVLLALIAQGACSQLAEPENHCQEHEASWWPSLSHLYRYENKIISRINWKVWSLWQCNIQFGGVENL